MRDIFDKEFQKEMDDFFDYIDGILDRDEDEVDVITDHLDDPMDDEEGEYWEMKAEIHNGI
jgi:frataxin-like iron-binding protein CyaY|tara:strand:- start:358 stop:540 length:183 start_codon:yes stop_codon:yes gene_type:complete